MGRTKLTISYPSIFHVIISHSPNVSTLPKCRTSFSAGCAGCLTHTSKLRIWPTPAEDIQCNFASEPNTTQAGRAPVCGLAQLRWFGAIYRAGSTLALVGHATSQKRLPGGQTGARPAPFRLDSGRDGTRFELQLQAKIENRTPITPPAVPATKALRLQAPETAPSRS